MFLAEVLFKPNPIRWDKAKMKMMINYWYHLYIPIENNDNISKAIWSIVVTNYMTNP